MTATTANADAAVRYLLDSPALADRSGSFDPHDEIDWAALLAASETMSGGQRILVEVAHDLWEARGAVGVSELVRRLDRTQFERVLTALRIFRGDEPAGSQVALAA